MEAESTDVQYDELGNEYHHIDLRCEMDHREQFVTEEDRTETTSTGSAAFPACGDAGGLGKGVLQAVRSFSQRFPPRH